MLGIIAQKEGEPGDYAELWSLCMSIQWIYGLQSPHCSFQYAVPVLMALKAAANMHV